MPGMWFGIVTRTHEKIVGIAYGVVKCRTATRLSDEEKWSMKQILQLRRIPWEFVPGRSDRRIPVAIGSNGNGLQAKDCDEETQETTSDEEGQGAEMQFRGGVDKLHVFRKAIEKYGPTEGCPVCTSIQKREMTKGRIGINHNDNCRKRVITAMREDRQYRDRNLGAVGDSPENSRNNNHDADRNDESLPRSSWKLEEQRGHLRKAVHAIKQKMKSTGQDITSQLDQTMVEMMIASVDVAEFYSPPRIIQMANQMGLRVGWSMGITTNDVDGKAWDFNIPEMRNRAARRILIDKPMLLIGSPMCIVYITMNNINHERMPREVVQERFAYARKHLQFAAQQYKMQVQGGRHFPARTPSKCFILAREVY